MNFHEARNTNFMSLLKHVSSSFIQARLFAYLKRKGPAYPVFWREQSFKIVNLWYVLRQVNQMQGSSGAAEGMVWPMGCLQCGPSYLGFQSCLQQSLGTRYLPQTTLEWALGDGNDCRSEDERRNRVAGGDAEAGHDLHKRLQNTLPKGVSSLLRQGL